MRSQMKETILRGTMAVFNQKGLKFTMDDMAKQLCISKKTIYKVFNDKEELFLDMVDYLFDFVKESEEQVMHDRNLTTLEKIRKIMGVMPDSYRDLDLRKLHNLKEKYPSIYVHVQERLETGWENTIALIEQGIREGVVRPVPICLIKMMFESALEQFFQRDVLLENKLSYNDALEVVVDIIISGIEVKRK